MIKLIIQILIILIYIGKYPRELQKEAPSVFLVLGILLFCMSGFIVEKVKQLKLV